MNKQFPSHQALVAGAHHWAQANRSDPFALDVALSHVDNGICDDTGFFDATPHKVKRHLPEGVTLSDRDTTFLVTEYKNMKRP